MTLLLAVLLGVATPTLAQAPAAPSAVEQARKDRLTQAVDALLAKKNDLALQLLDPLLVEYEMLYAKEKRQLFCADTPEESLSNLLGAAAARSKDKRGAVVIATDWCTALWGKGYILLDLGKADAAIPVLQRAITMRPSRPQYLNELGFGYQLLKKWPEMLNAETRAAEVADVAGPDRVRNLYRAWFGMAYALIELGRWDEAADLLQKCIALDPENRKAKDELKYLTDKRPKAKG